MKINTFLLAVLLALALSPAAGQIYGGLSAGTAFINKTVYDPADVPFTLDKNAFSYRLFGGIGGKLLGAEGGFRHLGTVKDEQSQVSFQSKTTGWDVALRGRLAVGPVLGFAKAGVFFSQSENRVGSSSYQDNATTFMWGFGGGIKLGLIGFRLEYENLDMRSDSKISVLSFGITGHLGGK